MSNCPWSRTISSDKVQDVTLDIDTAIPCGLILNELVSNALKHAFPDGRRGELKVSLGLAEGRCQLVVCDNGIGLPAGLDLEQTDSLGLRLVLALVEQLEATIELSQDAGAVFTITFSH